MAGVYFGTMDHDPTHPVLRAVRAAVRASDSPLVLAVSGGLDSMVLLHAVARVAGTRIAAVATYDHGSGRAATASAAFVAREASMLGLPVVIGRMDAAAPAKDGREAAWRTARYQFLRSVATGVEGRILVAHTQDDQVETVLMRVLRGSGARGLAGLYAEGDIVRPFVRLRRTVLREFAREIGVTWRADPGNRSRAHHRNRVRLDLLPALRRAQPDIEAELLQLAQRAATWRKQMDRFVDRLHPALDEEGRLRVAAQELAGYDRDSLCALWGALAARVGLALDRRGTQRLAAFTITGPASGSVPLAGGWYMEARGGVYILGKRSRAQSSPRPLPASGEMQWGAFRFRVDDSAIGLTANGSREPWCAELPVPVAATVRRWTAGDRLAPSVGQGTRRVKRYLSDAGVRGSDRVDWPVVVDGSGNVVWIPGVRRADAATVRSGRPVRHYVCERIAR
jgi:tRNA(Ile)-lysidine synthase